MPKARQRHPRCLRRYAGAGPRPHARAEPQSSADSRASPGACARADSCPSTYARASADA